MLRTVLTFILLTFSTTYGQFASIVDTAFGSYPEMEAGVYFFDENYDLVKDINISDILLEENRRPADVQSLSCFGEERKKISATIVIDISGSMKHDNRIESAKEAALLWVDKITGDSSETALLSFNDKVYVNSGFTTDKEYIKSKIKSLKPEGTTEYNPALLSEGFGAVSLCNTGKYKKVILFLTDGKTNTPLKVNELSEKLIENDISFYSVTIGELYLDELEELNKKNRGGYFPAVTDADELKEKFIIIQNLAQEVEPCKLKWNANKFCGSLSLIELNFEISDLGVKQNDLYKYPETAFVRMQFRPEELYFRNIDAGESADTVVNITAIHDDIHASEIISANSEFKINPTDLIIPKGETRELMINFSPKENSFRTNEILFKTQFCEFSYEVSGINYLQPENFHLDLLSPNGNEQFIPGRDTTIKWQGVLPEDRVKIEYSTNNGNTWQHIATSSGLEYNWNVPNTPSLECSMRLKTAEDNNYSYRILNRGLIQDIDFFRDEEKLLLSGTGIYIMDYDSNNRVLDSSFNNKNYYIESKVSPDGQMIATVNNNKKLIIMSYPDPEVIRSTMLSSEVLQDLEWFEDSRSFALAADNKVYFYNSGDLSLEKELEFNGIISDIDLNYDETKLSAVTFDNKLQVYEIDNDNYYDVDLLEDSSNLNTAWHPHDDILVYTLNSLRPCIFYDYEKKKIIDSISDGTVSGYSNIEFSYDGKYTAYINFSSNRLIIYENDAMKKVVEIDSVYSSSGSLKWHPSKYELIYIDPVLYDIIKVKPFENKSETFIEGFNNIHNVIQWDPEGKILAASANKSNTLEFYKTNEWLSSKIYQNDFFINDIKWSPKGGVIAFCGLSKFMYLLDHENLEKINSWYKIPGTHNSLDWDEKGQRIVSLNSQQALTVYNAEENEVEEWGFENLIVDKKIQWYTGSDKFTSIINSGNGSNSIANIHIDSLKIFERLEQNDTGILNDFEWNNRGTLLAIGGNRGHIQLYDKEMRMVDKFDNIDTNGIRTISWSPDGKRILCNSSGNRLMVINAETGVKEQIFNGHKAPVLDCDWNPKGHGFASSSMDGQIIYWDYEYKPSVSDSSDHLWAVIKPEISILDIDMGDVYTGKAKDSLVVSFIENTGKYDVKIDSVNIVDKEIFGIVDGLKGVVIPPGETSVLEFRFAPSNAGKVQTRAYLHYNGHKEEFIIRGNGVERKLEVLSGSVYFGKLQIENSRDSTIKALVKNNSELPLEIRDMEIVSDTEGTFALADDQEYGGFSINAGETADISLKFNALTEGITTGRLLIHYDEGTEPQEVMLYGTGIDTSLVLTVKIDDHEAKTGRIVRIPVILDGYKKYMDELNDSVSFSLKYNSTLLAPMKEPFGEVIKGTRIINYELPVNIYKDSLLTELFFKAALGNDTSTTLRIENIQTTNTLYRFEADKGYFRILDLCEEGGTRLLSSREGKSGIIGVKPNPASERVSIELNIIEKGKVSLSIINNYGNEKLMLLESANAVGIGKINADFSQYSSGIYFIILRTPSGIQVEKLLIVK